LVTDSKPSVEAAQLIPREDEDDQTVVKRVGQIAGRH